MLCEKTETGELVDENCIPRLYVPKDEDDEGIGRGDATVTYTQKQQGTPKDTTYFIYEVLETMNIRLCELYNRNTEVKNECIQRCEQREDDGKPCDPLEECGTMNLDCFKDDSNENCGPLFTCEQLTQCHNLAEKGLNNEKGGACCPCDEDDPECDEEKNCTTQFSQECISGGGDGATSCQDRCDLLFPCSESQSGAQEAQCKLDNQACITNCTETEEQIYSRAEELCELNSTLSEAVALDVHVVKDSTTIVEDLKAIAREELARKQYGEIAEKLIEELEYAGFITNYLDHLYNQSWNFAANYLLNNYFSESEDDSPLTEDEATQLKNTIITNSLSMDSMPKYTIEETDDIEEVLNTDKIATQVGGENVATWNAFYKAHSEENNPNAIYWNAYDAFNATKRAQYDAIKTQAIAGQGVLPLVMEDKEILDASGQPKTFITKPGSLVRQDQLAVAQGLVDLASSPEYAPAETAIASPGEVPLPPPINDMLGGNLAEISIGWYDSIIEDTQWSMYDVFCECFPEICEGWGLGMDIFDWDGFDFEIPGLDLNFCGISVCEVIDVPWLCDFGFDLGFDILSW